MEDAVGTLDVTNGGTGRTSLTVGYFLRGNGTGSIAMDSIETVKAALGVEGMKFQTGHYNGDSSLAMTNGVLLFDDDDYMSTNKYVESMAVSSRTLLTASFESYGVQLTRGTTVLNLKSSGQYSDMTYFWVAIG